MGLKSLGAGDEDERHVDVADEVGAMSEPDDANEDDRAY